jgi:osmotically-inducible protein OsmY
MIRTDEELKKSVVDHLFWDDSIDASGIKVEVRNAKAILSGSVPTYAAKDEASGAAWLVRGIEAVENRLEVRFPPGTVSLADEQILHNARNVLAWNNNIHSQSVQLTVENGVVTLAGKMPTYWQRNKAEELVSNLIGVVDVINNIIVVPAERLTDQDIAENIQTALENKPPLEMYNLRVSVVDGEVTLKGSVPTWRDRIDAFTTAMLARGVTNVENEIEVRP